MTVDHYEEFKAFKAAELGVHDDGFEHLFTPHRMAYIHEETPRGRAGEHDCPFCIAPGRSDEDALVVYRGKYAYALMNLFPYNSAHMLVCPYRHISNYEDATVDEVAEIGEITQEALLTLRKEFNPDGFNLGMNQGEVAGAGIAAHLHQHIVPRWSGDSNFFAITAGVRAVPTLLGQAREKLHNGWIKRSSK
ncbi:hydrolase [Actinomycetota bacterium]|nr:hydrolase [Actinomycetota bacterium]